MLALVVAVAASSLGPLPTARGSTAYPSGDSQMTASHGGKHHNGKGQHKKNDKKKKHKKSKRVKATATANYSVNLTCTYDQAADTSTCLISAVAPASAKKVQHVDLSASELCAEVTGGDFDIADPDPHTDVTGYRSHGTEAQFTLEFAGEVRVDGSATYWIKAASAIVPVRGPGFACRPEPETTAKQSPTPNARQTEPAQEVNDSAGSVLVVVRSCPIASAQTGYDWFGQCTGIAAGLRYHLMRLDSATRDGLATSTNGEGKATFALLPPGTYELTQAAGDWCFAQSDDVDAQGNVIVEAGARTTVWIFTCESGSGS
jgi:hypothetical protein